MLEYFVYNEDINRRQIIKYDVFKHIHFVRELSKMFKDIEKERARYRKENNLTGLATPKEARAYDKYMNHFEDTLLDNICQYHFWGRCEYETVVTSWTPSIDRKDVYKLVEEDKQYIAKWGKPAYRYTPKLSIAKKIDIYQQLKLNWEVFKYFVFSNEKAIKKLNKENLKKYPDLKKS